MNSVKTMIRILSFLAVVTATAGCAQTSPNLDKQFGNAIATLKRLQTIDHGAGERTDNPNQDGEAAAETNGRYVKSFAAPTPHQNVFTIGAGGSSR